MGTGASRPDFDEYHYFSVDTGALGEGERLLVRCMRLLQRHVTPDVLLSDAEVQGALLESIEYLQRERPAAIREATRSAPLEEPARRALTAEARHTLCDLPDCEACAYMRRLYRHFGIDLPWHPQDEYTADGLDGAAVADAKDQADQLIARALRNVRDGGGA